MLNVAAQSDELFARMAHDLNQPLSTIEHSACYLKLLLGDADQPVLDQLGLILRQVDLAGRIVAEFSSRMRDDLSQCAGEAEHLAFTNSQTAAVR